MIFKEYKESQKDCAKMLGMTLNEYVDFCANIKVPHDVFQSDNKDKTKDLMDYFGITDEMLKKRKDD